MLNYGNFINGKFVPATGKGKMTVVNPSDGKPGLYEFTQTHIVCIQS